MIYNTIANTQIVIFKQLEDTQYGDEKENSFSSIMWMTRIDIPRVVEICNDKVTSAPGHDDNPIWKRDGRGTERRGT